MNEDQQPTIEELKAVRDRLVQQIDEAPQLFDTGNNGHELLTSKSALKSIQELMRRTKKQNKADVA
jgi:hypothetical protein